MRGILYICMTFITINTTIAIMPLTVRLPKDLEKRLDELAKLTGRTKTYYVREALQAKLDELEDLYIAEHRLEHQEGPRWSLEQLERGADQTGRRTRVES